ncbi:MAG: hypothetical protein AABM29_02620 [Actinomycetota bacterium]
MRDDPTVRMIAIYPAQGGVSRMRELVLSTLRSKASRYGSPDEPYIIAVACKHWVSADHDFEEALYGPEVVQVLLADAEPVETTPARAPRGLWQRGTTISGRRVSAVIGAPTFSLFGIARDWPRLWPNPWAANPLETTELPWPQTTADLVANELRREDSLSMPAEFFELEPDWPGEPFQITKQHRRNRREQHGGP